MELVDINALVNKYKAALQDEAEAIALKADALSCVEGVRNSVLAQAYADGVVDGKNAETRKAQEFGVLNDDAEYSNATLLLANAEEDLGKAEVARKVADMHCALIKAWLYSQGGKL